MSEKIIEELEAYAKLEGSEAGEYWSALCCLAKYEYCMPDDLAKAVLKQVELEVEYIKDTMEIVEEAYPPSPVTIRYLREK